MNATMDTKTFQEDVNGTELDIPSFLSREAEKKQTIKEVLFPEEQDNKEAK